MIFIQKQPFKVPSRPHRKANVFGTPNHDTGVILYYWNGGRNNPIPFISLDMQIALGFTGYVDNGPDVATDDGWFSEPLYDTVIEDDTYYYAIFVAEDDSKHLRRAAYRMGKQDDPFTKFIGWLPGPTDDVLGNGFIEVFG